MPPITLQNTAFRLAVCGLSHGKRPPLAFKFFTRQPHVFRIQQPLMLNHLVNSKPELQHLSRHTTYNGIRRTAPRHHGAGRDYRTTSYGYAFQYCYIRSRPHIIFHRNWSVVIGQFLGTVHYKLAEYVNAVITRYYSGTRAEYHLPPDCKRSLSTIKRTALRYTASVADRHIPQPLQIA